MHKTTLTARKYRKLSSRVFRLLFKRRKALQVLSFRYSYRYLFPQSYLVIQCYCKNALWYQIKGYGIFTSDEMVLNLRNLAHHDLELTVQGLFSRRVFYLEVQPAHLLQTASFKTAIYQWRLPDSIMPAIRVQPAAIRMQPQQQVVSLPSIAVKVDTITFLPPSFNQADYI